MKHKVRTKKRIELNVAVEVEDESRLQQFYARNLSSGGIFLELPGDPPQIGTKLRLRFTIPKLERSFAVVAEVMHHHTYEGLDEKFCKKSQHHGIGLRFLDLKEDDEKVIEQYVTGKVLHVTS